MTTAAIRQLPTFSIDKIRAWSPCYDPARYLPADWRGTALDILKMESIPPVDRLWVASRRQAGDESLMRRFAVSCFRDTLRWVPDPDPRSIRAADTAERFADGLATFEEMHAASVDAMVPRQSRMTAKCRSAQAAVWCSSYSDVVVWATAEEAAYSWALSGVLGSVRPNESHWAHKAAQLALCGYCERLRDMIEESLK